MYSRSRAYIAWMAMSLGLLMPSSGLLAASPEQLLKAAFLYNFALYTEWPNRQDDFNLCILGKDSLGSAMDPIGRKEVAGRPINVIRLTDLQNLYSCHMVFIAASEHAQIPQITRSLSSFPILTVAEAGNYDPKLVMLRLNVVQGSLVFEANPTLARAAGLSLSAKMLQLARNVF